MRQIMVNTLPVSSKQMFDTWVPATWEDFLAASADAEIQKTRCYYDSGWMRIETMGVGSGHSQDNTLISQVVSLYGICEPLVNAGISVGR